MPPKRAADPAARHNSQKRQKTDSANRDSHGPLSLRTTAHSDGSEDGRSTHDEIICAPFPDVDSPELERKKRKTARKPSPKPVIVAPQEGWRRLEVGGFPLATARVALGGQFTSQQARDVHRRLAVELRDQEQHPPDVHKVRKLKLGEKPILRDARPIPDGISDAERLEIEEFNNELAEEKVELERSRNNVSALNGRDYRIKVIKYLTTLVKTVAAERDWLRLKICALGEDPREWANSVPTDVKAGMRQQLQQGFDRLDAEKTELEKEDARNTRVSRNKKMTAMRTTASATATPEPSQAESRTATMSPNQTAQEQPANRPIAQPRTRNQRRQQQQQQQNQQLPLVPRLQLPGEYRTQRNVEQTFLVPGLQANQPSPMQSMQPPAWSQAVNPGNQFFVPPGQFFRGQGLPPDQSTGPNTVQWQGQALQQQAPGFQDLSQLANFPLDPQLDENLNAFNNQGQLSQRPP